MELDCPKLYNTAERFTIEINRNPFTIGRGLNCDYVIMNQVISRLHCQLEQNEFNQWFLRDISTNGTYVNGKLIKSHLSPQLKHLDEIVLYPDTLKYIFHSISIDNISDEQLCMVADTVLNNLEASRPRIDCFPNTSLNGVINLSESVIDVSSDSVLEIESPASSFTNSHPKKRIKYSNPPIGCVIDLTVEKNPIPQNEVPSTSSNSNPVVNLIDNCQTFSSNQTDIKMVTQETSVPNVSVKVESDKASTSTNNSMGQSESRIAQEKRSDEGMDAELMCSICSEMFVKASTLNCSHTFCLYCIEMWKKKQKFCPICRGKITSQIPTLVLDNVIEKVIKNSSEQVQQQREELMEERKKLHPSKPNNKRRPPAFSVPGRTNMDFLAGMESPSDTSTVTEESDLEENWEDEYWNDDWYNNRVPYGGYGRCFACGRRGHWANGCPFR